MSAFRQLIAPLSFEDFLARHWEQTHFATRRDPAELAGLFSLAEVDTWLKSGLGRLFLTPPGEDRGTQSYRPSEISLSLAYAAFQKGSLLVLEPFATWPKVQPLVADLGREFHAEVTASAFVAPPGSGVFPPHATGQDTLVLQLEGEATWHLHEFSLLQRNPSEKKNLQFTEEWYGRSKTPVAAVLRLAPGDVLYIPRGMPFQVQRRDLFSLHLQLTVQPLGWMDLLKIAIDCAAVHSQDLRRSVPPGFLADEAIRQGLQPVYEQLLAALPALAPFAEVIAATQRNRVKAQDFPADGHFAQLVEKEALSANTVVEHRPDVLCFAEQVTNVDREPRSALFFGQELVAGPPHLLAAARFVQAHRRFRVAEIPGLDPASQVLYARRLIAEGLLRRAAEPAPSVSANGEDVLAEK